MNRTDLTGFLLNGEDSKVEFKRDVVQNHDLAKELVAFLNVDGGTVLLGVEDDATISGTTRDRLEEWVSELCRVKIEPPIVPEFAWVRDAEPGRDVLAVKVTLGPSKPYARIHQTHRTYYIRVGSTSREASREELERMFQASGQLHYGLKPVPEADWEALDDRRLRNYFGTVLGGVAPEEGDRPGWERLLKNMDLMVEIPGHHVATIDGLLLFGLSPQRFLHQSGIRAISYAGEDRDYATRADEDLRGPMVPIWTARGEISEVGSVEQALDFVRRNTATTSTLVEGRRADRRDYPEEAVREAVVNALVHRDYSIAGADILLEIFPDRLEVTSPGSLPNTVTPDGMRSGLRYARNQTLVNVMRDYNYVEARGMGVRNKMIPAMHNHNRTIPNLITEEQRLVVRLLKAAPALGD